MDKAFSIPSSWMAEMPSKRMDVPFWNLVVKAMDELGIDKKTAGKPEIQQALAHVKEKMRQTAAKVADLRAKAEKLRAKARKIEATQPDVPYLKIDESKATYESILDALIRPSK
jgi:hypothetical protein